MARHVFMLKLMHGLYLLVAEHYRVRDLSSTSSRSLCPRWHISVSFCARYGLQTLSFRLQSPLNEVCQEKNCIIDEIMLKPKPSPDFGKQPICDHRPLPTPHKDRSRQSHSDAKSRQTLLGCFSMDGDDEVFVRVPLAARSRYVARTMVAMLWRSICRCTAQARQRGDGHRCH